MDMLLRTYVQQLQWVRHCSCTRKNGLTGKLNCEQKKWIIKNTIWNVALYATETWTLTKASIKLLGAFEMWMWWRMLKISWTEKVTKEEVLVHANEARSILKTIWCRKHRWLGHVLRHDNLLHHITEEKCWARYVVRKGRSYCMIWWKGKIMDSWKI